MIHKGEKMKKLKLNQIIAISNGEKTRKQSEFSKIYQRLEKAPLFEGQTRRYHAKDEEQGEDFPSEDKIVQYTVPEAIKEATSVLETMFNIVATQDTANCSAKADVIVGETVILKDVPATHLIFLEKQLEDINTFIKKFPTLDPGEKWQVDSASNLNKSDTKETIKTKKIPKAFTLHPATEQHPAQTQLLNEDVTIGNWHTTRLSGAVSRAYKEQLLEKVRGLSKAIKIAREEANSIEVELSDIGKKVLEYIF